MTRAVVAAGIAGVVAAFAAFDAAAVLAAWRARAPRGNFARRWVGALSGIGRWAAAGGGADRWGARPRSGVWGGVDVDDRIAAAGVDLTTADVVAVKAGAALVALAAAVVVLPVAPGRAGLVLLVAAPAIGFAAPDVWLRRRAKARGRVMARELADVLDLLRVAVAAGLSPARALEEVGRRHPGLLAAELRRAAGARALGTAGDVAIERLERRCPIARVKALSAALRRADRHGAPLAPALAALAAEARAEEARRRIEAAARASPQIQLIVALLLVPAVMALIAAALLPALR